MSTVHIICGKYYDLDKKEYTVGGIQTYISALRTIISQLGLDCIIYQNSERDCETIIDDTKIISVKADSSLKDLKRVRKSFEKCMNNFDNSQDILLFSTDTRIIPNKVSRSIAIQHGINWDMPTHEDFSPLMSDLYIFSKARLTYKIISNLRKVKRVVCVDHNFPNWLRASCAYQTVKIDVIPNFTQIAEENKKTDDKINIIFARRFEKYRGTRIFAESIKKIIEGYSNVYVTFAGTGPDEKFLKDTFVNDLDRVEFITYKSGESLKVHADKHIAVVPTIGSEGTSLSLLEAMSAQCAVICTDVGGMSNIVLDGYNGLIADRNSESLYYCIKKLIDDEQIRKILSKRAYETVKEAFSYEVWREKWKLIFQSMLK